MNYTIVYREKFIQQHAIQNSQIAIQVQSHVAIFFNKVPYSSTL